MVVRTAAPFKPLFLVLIVATQIQNSEYIFSFIPDYKVRCSGEKMSYKIRLLELSGKSLHLPYSASEKYYCRSGKSQRTVFCSQWLLEKISTIFLKNLW